MNKNFLILFCLLIIAATHHFGQQNVYTVTAYCPCTLCINKRAFQDGKFASNTRSYWGGAAGPAGIPFGTQVNLVPLNPPDTAAIDKYFKGRCNFIIEDRGFLIRNKHIDIFIPPEMGGHDAALKWGSRQLRIVFLPTPP